MPHETTLGDLATLVGGRVVGDAQVRVSGVEHDSRAVRPGDLFVAIAGFKADGHEFVDRAVFAGAAAVCVERDTGTSVPQLIVEDSRVAMGTLASAVYGNPSLELRLVGVTGTNGKTTVTHMLRAIGRAAGHEVGVVGTVGAAGGTVTEEMVRTTPEAPELQRLLARFRDADIDTVAMEVSSHALALHRVAGTRFRIAAFTNLGRDHLDFHADVEAYYQAKAKLFTMADEAVIWIGDSAGARLAEEVEIPVTTVGPGGTFTATGLDQRLDSIRFTLVGPNGTAPVALPIGGRFNVPNALVAAAVAARLGFTIGDIRDGLASMPPIRGRFQVAADRDVTAIVDYAHTPDGIAEAIASVREASTGQVVVVIGAGGDRDHDKRPLMGRAASAADFVIITSDNPRTEDPSEIARAVREGVTGKAAVILDRREAIHAALDHARPGDVVLVLGKGHEQGQDFGDHVEPFDDIDVVHELLEVRA